MPHFVIKLPYFLKKLIHFIILAPICNKNFPTILWCITKRGEGERSPLPSLKTEIKSPDFFKNYLGCVHLQVKFLIFQHYLRMDLHKSFVFQCQILKALSSMIKLTFGEIFSITKKLLLSQLDCYTGNFCNHWI